MKDPVQNLKLAKYPAGDVTQWFGENAKLYQESMNMIGHNGIDIVRPHGTHMYAVEDGTIINVNNDASGYGKHVRLLSVDGKREWTYGHCSEIYVKVNQKVKGGQFIAAMGNTGFVISGNTPYWGTNPYAGTHLHFGLRYVRVVDSGWSYPGSNIKIMILNYENGFKGAMNPLKELHAGDKVSDRIEKSTRTFDNKVWAQLVLLLRKINL